MHKKFLLSSMTLLTAFLAVGCSNNSAKSNNSDVKSSQTSKKSHKVKKYKEKSEQDMNSSDTTSSKESSTSQNSNSNNSNNSNTQNNSNSNNSNSNTNKNNSQNTGAQPAISQIFPIVVNDTIKRDEYPSGTTQADFVLRNYGNGVYAVAEKKTGTVVNNYMVKNGRIYYQDVATGASIPLN